MPCAAADAHPVFDQWGVAEFAFTGPAQGDPFAVRLTAEARGPGRSVRVSGFYDGGGTYVVRHMPDAPGSWTLRTQSDQPELDGLERSYTCRPAQPGNHGPVSVLEGQHFAYADGTPFRPFGTTCYAWVHQAETIQHETLVTLTESPFNKLRMCVFPKHFRYNEREPDLYPYLVTHTGSSTWHLEYGGTDAGWDFDWDRFDPAFFQHLEARIGQLAGLGIEADLILFHPYDRWGFSRRTPAQDERYLRYLIARLAPFRNVWWSLANEWDLLEAKSEEDWNRILETVADADPYDHLRSVHNCFRFFDHSHHLLTHASIQHQDLDRVVAWRRRYAKPVVVDEFGYEGDLAEDWGNLSPAELVHRSWQICVGGGFCTHGETYLDPGDVLWWSHGGALHGESAERLAFLRAVLEDAPFPLEPLMNSLPTLMTLMGRREDYTMQQFLAFMLENAADRLQGLPPFFSAFPGLERRHEYQLVYLGPRQPRTFDVMVPSGESYRAEALDTWAMTVTRLSNAVTQGDTLELPGRPHLAVRLIRVS
ncbi:MAG TPA: DUF5060 domain-containing protein [Acidimicrobiales bacterium]|nr:DUF5060 domain-containing protein [Acidimicrobiales bacterium]